MPSPEQIVAVVAAFVIPLLAAFFKASGIGDPVKQYIEFGLSIVIAYVTLVITGKITPLPTLPTDPTQWFTILGTYAAVIAALALIVYNLLSAKIQQLVAQARHQPATHLAMLDDSTPPMK